MAPDPLLDLAVSVVVAHWASLKNDEQDRAFTTLGDALRDSRIAKFNLEAAGLAGPLNTFDNLYFGRDTFGLDD